MLSAASDARVAGGDWDGGAPNPQEDLQHKSSQAAGKHGLGLQGGLMGQAGQFWVFNIFILICTPVQTTCSQRTVWLPIFILLCAPAWPSANAFIPATTCPQMLGDSEGTNLASILS